MHVLQDSYSKCSLMQSQTLYWLDANLDKVESAGYDGSNRQLLLSSGVLHPFSITFHENALYWTDWQVRGYRVAIIVLFTLGS